jgi:predicted  nucleic acid-binding Zn-ribbon protein
MIWRIGTLGKTTAVGALLLALIARASHGAQPQAQAGESAGAGEVRKSEVLATSARGEADRKRNAANRLESAAKGVDAQIAELEREQGARSAGLSAARSEITRLEAEIPQLDGASRKLAEEIAASQQEITGNLTAIDPLVGRMRALEAQLNREQAAFGAVAQRLERANADLRRVSQDVADRERDLRQEGLSLQQTLDTRNVEQQNLARASAEMGSIPFEISQRERELRRLQSSIPALRDRLNVVESVRRRQEQELAPLRARIADLKREVEEANRAFRPIQAQADSLNAELQKADQRIAQVRNQVSALDREIAADKDREAKTREAIAASESALPALTARQPALEETRRAATTDIAALTAERKRVEARLEALQDEIGRAQTLRDPAAAGRLPELRAELAAQKSELTRVSGSVDRRRMELAAAENETKRLDGEISGARRSIAENIRLADQLRAAIPGREAARAGAAQEVDRLAAARHTVQIELDRTVPRLNDARQRVQAAEARLRPVEQELAREDAALDRIEREVGQARRALNTDLEARRDLEDRVRELDLRLRQLQTFSAQVAANIGALDLQIPALQNRVSLAEVDLNRLRSQENTIWRTRGAAEADSDRQAQIVKGLQDQYTDMAARVSALSERNRSLAGLIERDQQQIGANAEAARRNLARTQSIRAGVPQDEKAIALAGERLPSLRNASTAAWAEFGPAGADASAAEKAAADAATNLAEVRAVYDRQRLDARQVGEKQGSSQGLAAGRAQGAAEGEVSGKELGAAAGRQEGLAAGFARGSAEGGKKGADEGYQRGLETPAHYQQGLTEGLDQGVRDAWAEARRVDNPRGRAARRAELLAGLQSLTPGDAPGAVTPDVAAREPLSAPIEQNAIASAPAAAMAAAVPGAAGMPVPVPAAPPANGAPNCELRFTDLNQACAEEFKAAFQSSYINAYSAAFRDSHDRAFAVARATAYDASVNVRYADGYDAGYRTANAEGERRGASEARQKGYGEGRAQGFDRAIAEARAAEFEKGRDDESKFFADNPVVRILGATFSETAAEGEAGDIVAGDTLVIDLALANPGGVAAPAGTVQAQLRELSPAINMPARTIELPAVPASTTKMVVRTPLVTVPDIPAGSEIDATLIVTLPGGETTEIPLTAVVAANLPMTIEQVSTETNPRVGKSYGLKVKFTNSSLQDTFDDLRVVLSADPALVRVDKAEAKPKKLKAHQEGEADLKFTILGSEAAGKNVPLKVTVFHGRNVSARVTATVVPKP